MRRRMDRKIIFSSTNKGAAMVEFALASILMLMLVLGILEFGVMFRNYLAVGEVARTAARSAALGSSVSVIENHIDETKTALGLDSFGVITSVLTYRVYNKSTGTWTGWQTLSTGSDGYNTAPCDKDYDSQVRVTVSYTYPLVTGSFLEPFIGRGGNVTLTASSVMRREQTP